MWPFELLLLQELPAAQNLQLPETCANAAANEDDDDDDAVLPVSAACCFIGQHMPVLVTVNTCHPCCAQTLHTATCML